MSDDDGLEPLLVNFQMLQPADPTLLEPLTVTVRDAMRLTGLGERIIRQLCYNGTIRSFNTSNNQGGARYIEYASLKEWVQEQLARAEAKE